MLRAEPSHAPNGRSRRLGFYTLILSAVLLGATIAISVQIGGRSVQAQPPAAVAAPKRTVSDRTICRAVTQILNKDHLTRHPLNDEISERALKLFIKALDPMKLYFYQSDIDELLRNRTDLDEFVKAGDMTFATNAFTRLQQRIDERVQMVDKILASPVDFTLQETMTTDPEKLNYPKTPEEAYDRWRMRIKYDLLVLKHDKTEQIEGKAAIDRLQRRYTSFAKRMKQTDTDELLEMFLSSVTTSFDPHTTYMSPSTLDNFDISMKLKLDGIGAALKMNDGFTEISDVIAGGAAHKEGSLKKGDRIVSVGQNENGEMVDVLDKKLNDVVALIRGKAGTVVRLGVVPKAGGDTKIYTITRASIELTSSEARGQIIEDGKKPDGSPYRVGVIDLPSFYMDMEGARKGDANFKSTTRDVKALLDGFNTKGVDCVVLDLRHNGGGSLTEAINLTGLFIDEGPVVQVKDSAGAVQHYDDMERGMTWKGPLVVLDSKFSASASEIFAGAIQDYRRGIIVGDSSTHGKGTVQSLLELGRQLFVGQRAPNLGALKITMQQFYRPNGDSTQHRGVVSDVVIPSLTDHIEGITEGELDHSLAFDKVPANTFSKYNQVSTEILTQLRARSGERIRGNEEFAKLSRTIERYTEQKTKKEVPLNEEKFLAQRKEVDADREEEKQFEDLNENKPAGEIVKRDFYFNEVLNISVDYLKLLGQNTVAKVN